MGWVAIKYMGHHPCPKFIYSKDQLQLQKVQLSIQILISDHLVLFFIVFVTSNLCSCWILTVFGGNVGNTPGLTNTSNRWPKSCSNGYPFWRLKKRFKILKA